MAILPSPTFCYSCENCQEPQQQPHSTPKPALPIGFYAPYNTPPYITPPYSTNWQPPNIVTNTIADNEKQPMRFPTPPITPPREVHYTHTHTETTRRTQSVIMKVQADSPLHAPVDLYALDEAKSCSGSSSSSSSSSSECGASSDIICDWLNCGRVFDNLEQLASHVTQLHAVASLADGLYYCRWTGCQRSERGFNARYKMLVHVRTHTKEKPHRCHLCEKSFSRAENLKIHIRSHSGEKPYKCSHPGCDKAYSNSSDRFKHTRTHSMEKPYVCKVSGCQKRYTDPSSLRKHVKTFKHSIQLMTTSNHHTMKLNDLNHVTVSMSDVGVSDGDGVGVNVGESAPSYYIKMASDYADKSEYTSSYWINASTKVPEHSYLDTEDFSMDISNIESPLDLRVNRS